jgi:hypothetical protein
MVTRGKRIVLVLGLIALGVSTAGGIAVWRQAVEWRQLRRLESHDEDIANAAAKSLARMGSRRAIEQLLERWVEAEPKAVRILLPLDPVRRRPPLGEGFFVDRIYFTLMKEMGVGPFRKLAWEVLAKRSCSLRARTGIAQALVAENEDGTAPRHPIDLAIRTYLEALECDDLVARAGGAFGLAASGREAERALPALENASRDPSFHGHAEEAIRKIRGNTGEAEPDGAYREREEPAVLEAAFRRALTDEPNPRSDLFTLSYRDGPDAKWKEPSEALIGRLGDLQDEHGRPICTRVNARVEMLPTSSLEADLAREETHQDLVECSVTIVKWISRREVEISVTIYAGPLAGSGFRAKVIKTDDGWFVSPGSITDRIIS